MSSLIGSAAATACGHPLPGDIPYLLWLCDGPATSAEGYIRHILYLHQMGPNVAFSKFPHFCVIYIGIQYLFINFYIWANTLICN